MIVINKNYNKLNVIIMLYELHAIINYIVYVALILLLIVLLLTMTYFHNFAFIVIMQLLYVKFTTILYPRKDKSSQIHLLHTSVIIAEKWNVYKKELQTVSATITMG